MVCILDPGTAFTRSIGDSIAESIGVIANPEIVVLELTQNHPLFVIASDSVFEFLSSQTAVDMAASSISANSDMVVRPPLLQLIEVLGSESPSLMNWRTRNQRGRHDISRARLRALECSLENGQAWVPSSPAHRINVLEYLEKDLPGDVLNALRSNWVILTMFFRVGIRPL